MSLSQVRTFWFICFLGLAYYFHTVLPSLPHHVPSNFDFSGKPFGFWEKSHFVVFFVGFSVFLNAVFLLASTWLLEKVPWEYVGLPWKKHWSQSEQHKTQAYHLLRKVMAAGGVFVNIHSLLVLDVIVKGSQLPGALPVPASYSIFVIAGVALLFAVYCILAFRPTQRE